VRAAKVLSVKQLFRNAAHSERPIDPVSNAENPAFLTTFKLDFSEKVPYQGWYGEDKPRGIRKWHGRLAHGFIIAAFRSAKERVINATFAEQKATITASLRQNYADDDRGLRYDRILPVLH